MKKLTALLLTVVLVLACTLPVGALADTSVAWVKMSSSDGTLNLRKGSSRDTGVAGYVKAGDAIKVYDDSKEIGGDNEEWAKVKVNRTGKTGYIKTKYISYKATGAVTAKNTINVGSSGGSMNVRSGAGTSFSIAGYAVHGEAIEVKERGTTWSKIKVVRTGKVGYIKTKYIKGSTSTGTGSGSSGSGSGSNVSSGSYDVAKVMTKTAFGAVNLRKGADTSYSSITKLSRGTRINVLSKSGNWYKVKTSKGTTGYIHKDYVVFGANGKTTGGVNFRKGAGTNYGVIKMLSSGTSVVVHSVAGNWAKITAGGRTGYIHINYLSM